MAKKTTHLPAKEGVSVIVSNGLGEWRGRGRGDGQKYLVSCVLCSYRRDFVCWVVGQPLVFVCVTVTVATVSQYSMIKEPDTLTETNNQEWIKHDWLILDHQTVRMQCICNQVANMRACTSKVHMRVYTRIYGIYGIYAYIRAYALLMYIHFFWSTDGYISTHQGIGTNQTLVQDRP